MTPALRNALLAALAVVLLFLPGRATLPPLDRDEPRYMEASAQMLRSRDFVDVRFQDQPRYLQPAGIYWLEAGAVALGDALSPRPVRRQVWFYRLPSLVAVVASVLMTLRLGTVLFGRQAGLLAGLLLAVSVLMTAEGRMATIDSCLLAAILALQSALLRVWSDRDGMRGAPAARSTGTPARTPASTPVVTPASTPAVTPVVTPAWAPILFWAALGVGLMLKGPVMLIPALGTPLALALAERRIDWWRRLRPGPGVLLTLAIVSPWCVLIWLRSHGVFFERAVGTNFLGKVASGQQAHGLPPGYHLAAFAIAFWPGSLFAAMAIPFVWMRRRTAPVRFLLCWIVPHWLVFELIATKLPHYVLPCYPAIALLAAASLAQPGGWRWPAARWGRALLGLYALLWLAVGIALCAAGPVLLLVLQRSLPLVSLLAPLLALPLLLLSAGLLLRGRPRDALCSVAGGAAILYVGLFLVVVPRLTTIWLSPRIADAVAALRPCPDSVLASASFSEPSLVFLAGQQTRLVNADAAADVLANDRACGLALIGSRDEAAFRAGLARHALGVVPLRTIDGVNYSTGKRLSLRLYRAAGG